MSASKSKKTYFSYLLIYAATHLTLASFAEGSKEITSNGGYRPFLVSTTIANLSNPFPTKGTMKVYAKVGEAIYTGSSAQGFGAGSIILRSPNGATYNSGNSVTIGLIANRNQEVAGPLPNAGGYTPFIRTVLPGEEGIWEVDFISQSNGAATGGNPVPVVANANWTQPTGQYITAFDVSVRNITNTAFLTGRTFTNVFTGILGTFDVGFNGIFKVLTKDGYFYTLDNNGQAGNGFSFFVNNKGFRDVNGAPSYMSINTIVNPNIYDPRLPDTDSDISHKIFFNDPAPDLPQSANVPGGGTTWLVTSPLVPTLTNVAFSGTEGTPGRMGTNPLGASFTFNANKNGNYSISIDVNKNGVFTDLIDRKLLGTVNAGANQVFWDGLDGIGNKVPVSGSAPYVANLNIILYGGEVHFPFFDVERNVNGLKLTRTNGFASPDNTVYWDDSPITPTGTPSNPIKNISGLNSFVNGHKWGTPGAGANEFGDETGLDTWSYISAAPLVATLTFDVQEADLQVLSLDVIKNCKSPVISFVVAVKNNGPSNSSASKFSFSFPSELTAVTVSSTATSGTSAVTSSGITPTSYDALLNLPNGAVRTFTISGTVPVAPPSGDISVTASMLRMADSTDPDATKPDAPAPTDPALECDAAPSGSGCNNIRSLTSFAGVFSAGPDQTVRQFTNATISSSGLGIWVQKGSTPSQATITSPGSPSTTISGLNIIGVYEFIRNHENGCTDTIAIRVIASDGSIDIPNIFTPNGDGKNDVFAIFGIENYPGSRLTVFNRWGNEVYRSESYQNTWDGSNLADGTYFYTLLRKETGGSTLYKGWLYLKKQ